jgi:hypothetical protein
MEPETIPICSVCGEYLIRIETSNYSLYAYKWNKEEAEWVGCFCHIKYVFGTTF